jgi:ABC-2 type transport system ATP-binding protein
VESVPGVESIEARGDEMIITARDGAATIGAVAVALNTIAPVRYLTLRTPTLDDVFLELTGNHIQSEESVEREVVGVGR